MISADTDLFVYAYDNRDLGKQIVARRVIGAMGAQSAAVGLQVVGELQNALSRRLRTPRAQAYQVAQNVLVEFPSFAYDEAAVDRALGEAIAGRLSYWDALLLGAADAVGVTAMISEDMADGLVFGGLEVINPFGRDGPSARVRQLLAL